MDKSIKKTVEVLKDLIKVNYDRMEAYKDATARFEGSEPDLISVFGQMVTQGSNLSAELTTELMAHGKQPEENFTVIGSIYREWMSINLLFNGNERPELLDFCEYIEDAILMVYESARVQDDITETARTLIEKQQQQLRNSYESIKQLRAKELAYY